MLEARCGPQYTVVARPARRSHRETRADSRLSRPNGSGKSTTVRMLVGLMEPSNGDVLWKGKSIFLDLPGYRKQLGYVPEEPFLYTHLTAPEYLRLVGGLRGVDDAVLETKIDRFLELFDLEDDKYSTLSAFSKGMRQKVLLATALTQSE